MLTLTNLLLSISFLLGLAVLPLFASGRDSFFVLALLGAPSPDSAVAVAEKYGLVLINTELILHGLLYYSARHKIGTDDQRLRYLLTSFDKSCVFTLSRDTFVLSCNDQPVAQKMLKSHAAQAADELKRLSNSPGLHTYSRGLISTLSKQAKRAGYNGVLCTGMLCGVSSVVSPDISIFVELDSHAHRSAEKGDGTEALLAANTLLVTAETDAQILRLIFDEVARSKVIKRRDVRRFTVLRPKDGVPLH